MDKIRRISCDMFKYRNGEYVLSGKIVMTKLDDTYYLVQHYGWNGEQWVDHHTTSKFDGTVVHNGVIHSTAGSVDRMFDLRIEHEGFHEVERDLRFESCRLKSRRLS